MKTNNWARAGVYDTEGRRKYLTRAEGEIFLRHAALLPRTSALFCLFMYYTGCRISEALNMTTSDIDPELGAVVIRSLKKRGKKELRRVPCLRS